MITAVLADREVPEMAILDSAQDGLEGHCSLLRI